VKVAFAIIVLFFLYSCSNQKKVFWCGDHECANKKERLEFFKENLSVEVKYKNTKNEEDTDIKKIIKQEKKIKKKKKINNENVSINEIKNKKKINKKILNKKVEKISKKEIKKEEITKNLVKNEVKDSSAGSDFNKLVEKIRKQSEIKEFPDINFE